MRGITSDLYDFQLEGHLFLLSDRRRYLADGMGLGKTVQACHAVRGLMPDLRSALVVAPASTLPNWRREWKKWGPTHEHLVVGFTSWAKVHECEPGDWELVILDEAHYAKNPRARRTKAALAIAAAAEHAWLLSGTPMPNDPTELWAPIRALWPELIPAGVTSEGKWLNRYCKWRRTQYGPKVYGIRRADELGEILKKFMLRRKLEEVGIQLPPARLDVYYLPDTGALDERIAEELGLDVEEMKRRAAELEDVPLSSLRRLLGEVKVDPIAWILREELRDRAYQKVVIMAHHRDVLYRLRDVLRDYGVAYMDGSTLPAARQAAIDDFTHDPSVRVFLGQQTAAGTGLNLQVAHEVVLVEPSWTPAENAQAIKRVHRIGTRAPVRARIFAVENTLDEAIVNAITTKTRMALEVGL